MIRDVACARAVAAQPGDEVADGIVDASGTEEGGRHCCLLDLVRRCRNEFHFVVGKEVLLDNLSNHNRIKVSSHRNRSREGRDDERRGYPEPRDDTQTDSTEHVQDHDNCKSENQLDHKRRPHSKRCIKPELDSQEDRIQQSRWAQIFNETHLQVLQVIKKKMDDVTMVQQMTGCTREEANRALLMHETVVDAIAAIIPANPVTPGNKYIPAKPKIDTGMDAEQIALCERGRWLQDKVNAVFSVGHSKTLSVPQAVQALPELAEQPAVVILPASAEESESSQDNLAQTAQPAQQSAPPQ